MKKYYIILTSLFLTFQSNSVNFKDIFECKSTKQKLEALASFEGDVTDKITNYKAVLRSRATGILILGASLGGILGQEISKDGIKSFSESLTSYCFLYVPAFLIIYNLFIRAFDPWNYNESVSDEKLKYIAILDKYMIDKSYKADRLVFFGNLVPKIPAWSLFYWINFASANLSSIMFYAFFGSYEAYSFISIGSSLDCTIAIMEDIIRRNSMPIVFV